MNLAKRVIIVFLVGILITVTALFINDRFDAHGFSDAFFITSILLLSISSFSFISNNGVFDIAIYGIQRIFGVFSKKSVEEENDKPKNYFEYKQKRWSNDPIRVPEFTIVGVINLLITFILAMISMY